MLALLHNWILAENSSRNADIYTGICNAIVKCWTYYLLVKNSSILVYFKYDHKHVQGQKNAYIPRKNLPKFKYYFHFNIYFVIGTFQYLRWHVLYHHHIQEVYTKCLKCQPTHFPNY